MSFRISLQKAAAAAFFVFCAPCAAQEVAKPEVKVGDRWTYLRMDYDTNQQRGRHELRVVFAERGVIQVVSRQQGGDEEHDTTYTADWNAVTTPGRVFNPHSGWFRFPLRVGATYSAAFEAGLLKRGQGAESRNERTVKVVGWEEIEVPAGKFRALKIVADGRFQRLDKSAFSGSSRNVIWYVPEVRRWAKFTSEIRPGGGRARGEHAGEELVEYRLQ